MPLLSGLLLKKQPKVKYKPQEPTRYQQLVASKDNLTREFARLEEVVGPIQARQIIEDLLFNMGI